MTEEELDVFEQQIERRYDYAQRLGRGALAVSLFLDMGIVAEIGYVNMQQASYGDTQAESFIVMGCMAALALKVHQVTRVYRDYIMRRWQQAEDQFIETES